MYVRYHDVKKILSLCTSIQQQFGIETISRSYNLCKYLMFVSILSPIYRVLRIEYNSVEETMLLKSQGVRVELT